MDTTPSDQSFQFQQIEGMLPLEEATKELVHIAKCMQESHTNASASVTKMTSLHMFNIRKAGIMALLDLIEEYENQKPD